MVPPSTETPSTSLLATPTPDEAGRHRVTALQHHAGEIDPGSRRGRDDHPALGRDPRSGSGRGRSAPRPGPGCRRGTGERTVRRAPSEPTASRCQHQRRATEASVMVEPDTPARGGRRAPPESLTPENERSTPRARRARRRRALRPDAPASPPRPTRSPESAPRPRPPGAARDRTRCVPSRSMLVSRISPAPSCSSRRTHSTASSGVSSRPADTITASRPPIRFTSTATTTHCEPKLAASRSTSAGSRTAAVLTETLSAPARSAGPRRPPCGCRRPR